MSLLELILKTKVSWDHFQHMHVWGCPCYVLEPTLQDGHKLPKWNHISSWAIFLGFLSCHSSHVPLVLNLDTGHVSPQFHMVFEDWLTRVILATVSKSFNLTQWMELFADSHPHYTLDDNDPVILADEWVVDHETHVDHFAKIDAAQGCGPYLQREKRPQTEGDAHLIFDFVLPFSAPPPPPPSGGLVDNGMEDHLPLPEPLPPLDPMLPNPPAEPPPAEPPPSNSPTMKNPPSMPPIGELSGLWQNTRSRISRISQFCSFHL